MLQKEVVVPPGTTTITSDLTKTSILEEDEEDATSVTEEGEDEAASIEESEEDFKSASSTLPTNLGNHKDSQEDQEEGEVEDGDAGRDDDDEEEESVSPEPSHSIAPTVGNDKSDISAPGPANNVRDSGSEEEVEHVLVNLISRLLIHNAGLIDTQDERRGENSNSNSRSGAGSVSLVNKAIQFLDEFGIGDGDRKRRDFPGGSTIFSFGMQLENCNVSNQLQVNEEDTHKTVLIYCIIRPLLIPEEKRQTAIEFFTRANYDLLNGCFECDLEDGMFRYKLCSGGFVGAEITYETIEHIYFMASDIMSRHFGGLMQVLYCRRSPTAALQDCQAPPPSEAGACPQQ